MISPVGISWILSSIIVPVFFPLPVLVFFQGQSGWSGAVCFSHTKTGVSEEKYCTFPLWSMGKSVGLAGRECAEKMIPKGC